MSQDDAYVARKLAQDRGFAARIRRLPGYGDAYQVIVKKRDGDVAKVDSRRQLARLLDRWG